MKKKYFQSIAMLICISLFCSQIVFADTPQASVSSSENSTAQVTTSKDEIVPGKIIVKYKNDSMANSEFSTTSESSVTLESVKSISNSIMSETKDTDLGCSTLTLTKDADVMTVIDQLKADPGIEFAEPVYIRKANVMQQPTDNYYTNNWQWGLNAISAASMWNGVDTNALKGIKIAVVDTGVDLDHPELINSLVPGYDFVNCDTVPDDDDGHGTHVAGIIAASSNGIGAVGVAPGVKIMPVKVLDNKGFGDTEKIALGIKYAVNHGAKVINLSLGGSSFSIYEKEAIDYAIDRKVTVVAATGNDGLASVSYPAAYERVIGVGAADIKNGSIEIADFSNTGDGVDLVAPGVDILSTYPSEFDKGDAKQDGYTLLSGTSMATPYVAGFAAMVLANNPSLNCGQVCTELAAKAINLGNSSIFGSGLISGNNTVIPSNNQKFPKFNLHLEPVMGDPQSTKVVVTALDLSGNADKNFNSKIKVLNREFNYRAYEDDRRAWKNYNDIPTELLEIPLTQGEGSVSLILPKHIGTSALYVQSNGGYYESDYFWRNYNESYFVNLSGKITIPKSENSNGMSVTVKAIDTETHKIAAEYTINVDSIEAAKAGLPYALSVPKGKKYLMQYETSGTSGYMQLGFYSSSATATTAFLDKNAEIITPAGDMSNINMSILSLSEINDDYANSPEDTVNNPAGNFSSKDKEDSFSTEVNGKFDFWGDIDYFSFEVTKPSDYIIEYNGQIDNPNDFTLLGSDLTPISLKQILNGANNAFYCNLNPGKYYLKVTGLPSTPNGYNFTIKSAVKVTGKVYLQGTDKASEATAFNTYVYSSDRVYNAAATIPTGSEYGEYTCYVPFGVDYGVRTCLTSDNKLIFYNSTKTTLLSSEAQKINCTSDVSGIDMKFIPFTNDAGSTKETAKAIKLDAETMGTFDYFVASSQYGKKYSEENWFKFDVADSDFYNILCIVDGASINHMMLLNKDGETIYDDYYGKDALFIEEYLKKGTYYFMVDGTDIGEYGLKVNKTRCISGTITVPSGYAVPENGISITVEAYRGNNLYNSSNVLIAAGESSVQYMIPVYPYSQYTVRYKINRSGTQLNENGMYSSYIDTTVGSQIGVNMNLISINIPIPSDNQNTGGTSPSGGAPSGGAPSGGGAPPPPFIPTSGVVTPAAPAPAIVNTTGTIDITKDDGGNKTAIVKVDAQKIAGKLDSKTEQTVPIDAKASIGDLYGLNVNVPGSILEKANANNKVIQINSDNAIFMIQPGTILENNAKDETKLSLVQVSQKDIAKVTNLNPEYKIASTVYDFGLSVGDKKVTKFNKPMTITIKYDTEKFKDSQKVAVYYYNEATKEWEYIGGKANKDGTITFETSHFSKYAVLEYNKTFSDISKSPMKAEIELFAARHIIDVDVDNFYPKADVTREEFVSMVVKGLNIPQYAGENIFSDVSSNSKYVNEINAAYKAGIIGGTGNGKFGPEQKITREQMAAVLVKAYSLVSGIKIENMVTTMEIRFKDQGTISGWAKQYVILANALGFVNGSNGNYMPKANTTKEQSVIVVKKIMDKLKLLD